MSTLHYDITTQQGQRDSILNLFLMEHPLQSPEYDTLLDLNFDGNEDYAIGWYAMAGSGLKHSWTVWMWHPQSVSFTLDTTLTYLPNPSFFSKEREVTSFYLAGGMGSGEKLKWTGMQWRTVMRFEVEPNEEKSVWQVFDITTGKKTSVKHPYTYVPPQKIIPHRYGHE